MPQETFPWPPEVLHWKGSKLCAHNVHFQPALLSYLTRLIPHNTFPSLTHTFSRPVTAHSNINLNSDFCTEPSPGSSLTGAGHGSLDAAPFTRDGNAPALTFNIRALVNIWGLWRPPQWELCIHSSFWNYLLLVMNGHLKKETISYFMLRKLFNIAHFNVFHLHCLSSPCNTPSQCLCPLTRV